MGKLKKAMAGAAISLIDHAIAQIPDPGLRVYLSTASLAVKVPYYMLLELVPSETEKFAKEVFEFDKVTQKVIQSAEFQQALGSTLMNLIYAKESERQEVIKKAFIGAYLNADEYAKDNLERLQETALAMSLPAIQHLAFIKTEIFPIRELNLRGKPEKSQKLGFTDTEYRGFLKKTSPISHDYNSWYQQEKQRVEKEFNRNKNEESRKAFDLFGAEEEKKRFQFGEYWAEYNSRGIFKQGNDPAIGTFNGGSGTVQFITEFGERLIEFMDASSVVHEFTETN